MRRGLCLTGRRSGWAVIAPCCCGDGGDAPIRWPAQSFIPLDPGRPTLVLFAHPRCPCTRATIGELALLMASVPGRLNAQVWFLQPENTGADWTNTDLWSSAAAIPGVTVRADSDGREAARFHAATSGQALLYGTDGHLLFTGGITIARGHSGDNPGRSAIADLVMDQPTQTIQTPVFGCSLFNSQCQTRGPAWKP